MGRRQQTRKEMREGGNKREGKKFRKSEGKRREEMKQKEKYEKGGEKYNDNWKGQGRGRVTSKKEESKYFRNVRRWREKRNLVLGCKERKG